MKRWPLQKAYFWETAPFFRIVLPVAAGIAAGDAGLLRTAGYLLPVLSVLAAIALLVFAGSKSSSTRSAVFAVCTHILLFAGGYALFYVQDIRNNPDAQINPRAQAYLVRLSGAPEEKEHTWKLPVTLLRAVGDGTNCRAAGNAMLYVYKDDYPMPYHSGDSLLAPARWEPVHNPGNPYEFDYAAYCRRNNMLLQQTCGSREVRLTGAADPSTLPATERMHQWCMKQLDTYLADKETRGLIQAMLLGDEANLDHDLLRSYSDTGIVHIIAISGSNVAFFFLLISALLAWLKHRKHLWIRYAVALPLVWFYVLMAGAPPSAVRAAIMFSLLALTITLQRNSNNLNQLFATAFVLLCAQPSWLFSPGFQLSFTAVLSLLLFYSPIHGLLRTGNPVLKVLWSTAAASMAAELLVAPLVIYYFHTLPLMFLAANVIAYFFMGFAVLAGVAVVALCWLPPVATLVGTGTSLTVKTFDHIVVWMQHLNPEPFHFLNLSVVELLCMYVVIASVSAIVLRQIRRGWITALAGSCLLLALLCSDQWEHLHQERFVVFNTGGQLHAEYISGRHYRQTMTDSTDADKTRYAVNPCHTHWGAWRADTTKLGETAAVNGKSILILRDKGDYSRSFHADYLVVDARLLPDVPLLQQQMSPGQIIVGGNLNARSRSLYNSLKNTPGTHLYCVALQGAFVLN